MAGSNPKCDVVIVSYNSGPYLLTAVDSVRSSALVNSVIVVDNASADSSLDALYTLDDPKLKIIENRENLGFGKASNQGMALGRSEYVLLLNPDCRLESGALEQLLGAFQSEPKVGVTGPLLLNSDGTEQAGGRRLMPTPAKSIARALGALKLKRLFPNLISDFALHESPLPDRPAEVEAISGACMLVSRAAMDKVGMFDERYFLHCEDLDWCVRFRQSGYSILFVPDAKVFHEKGVSSEGRPFFVEYYKHRGMVRFYRKFFRNNYPWYLFYAVVTAVWVRYCVVSVSLWLSKLWNQPREKNRNSGLKEPCSS